MDAALPEEALRPSRPDLNWHGALLLNLQRQSLRWFKQQSCSRAWLRLNTWWTDGGIGHHSLLLPRLLSFLPLPSAYTLWMLPLLMRRSHLIWMTGSPSLNQKWQYLPLSRCHMQNSQFLHKLTILLNLHVDNPMAIPLSVKFNFTLLLVLFFTYMTTLMLFHYFIEQSRRMGWGYEGYSACLETHEK